MSNKKNQVLNKIDSSDNNLFHLSNFEICVVVELVKSR